jgi:hypothetical protein
MRSRFTVMPLPGEGEARSSRLSATAINGRKKGGLKWRADETGCGLND